MNQINVIKPYVYEGEWVFDDQPVGLRREPFVAGTDLIIDELTAGIENAQDGFTLIFSKDVFPNASECFVRGEPEAGGYWYTHAKTRMKGWLCPAMFKYFKEPPIKLYVQVKPL